MGEPQGAGTSKRVSVVTVIGIIGSVIAWFAAPPFQEFVCGLNAVVWVEDHHPKVVRAVCTHPSAWTPTPAEIDDLTDTFLAVAGGSQPGAARARYYSDKAQAQVSQPDFESKWQNVVWAQRLGNVQGRSRGNGTVRYEIYETSNDLPVPKGAVRRRRDVNVDVMFDDQRHLRFVSPWLGERRVDADQGVHFPRAVIGTGTAGHNLPDQSSDIGSSLPTGNTVRLICRLETSNRDWIRTTDGWVPTNSILDQQAVAGLPGCEPQHAQRAAKMFGGKA